MRRVEEPAHAHQYQKLRRVREGGSGGPCKASLASTGTYQTEKADLMFGIKAHWEARISLFR